MFAKISNKDMFMIFFDGIAKTLFLGLYFHEVLFLMQRCYHYEQVGR